MVLAACRGEILDEFQLVSLSHIYETTLDVCAGESQDLFHELALTLSPACDAHAQDVGVKLDGRLDILDYEPCMEK